MQPDWVCADCGVRYGKGPMKSESTWHVGRCGVCGMGKAVTEPRDFGYLAEDWEKQEKRRK